MREIGNEMNQGFSVAQEKTMEADTTSGPSGNTKKVQ